MRTVSALITAFLIMIGLMATPATAADSDSFTLAVIPDTQFSAQHGSSTFVRQTQWLADNADRLDLEFVLHEGDIVQDVCSPVQWDYADLGISVLEDADIPYAISPGNHDIIGYAPCPVTKQFVTEPYNDTFPLSRAKSQDGYGGSFDDTGINTYYTFSAGETDYLVIALQFGPSADQVTWARNVAARFPYHHAILLTHDFLSADGTLRGDADDAALPSLTGQKNGQYIWDNFVREADNVQFTFNGHVSNATPNGTIGYSSALNNAGRTVHRMLANYQDVTPSGGLFGDGGFIRLLTFDPKSDTIAVRTYSPTLDRYLTDRSNQFFLHADLSPGMPERLPFSSIFKDVTRSHPFFDEIEAIYRANITNGWSDGTFRPLEPVSRQAAAAMVYRSMPGADKDGPNNCRDRGIAAPFKDVPADHPFCFAIYSLKQIGQINGWDDGTFRPTEEVSRQAFAAFMSERGTVTESSFWDVTPTSPLAGPIETAHTIGVTTGYPDGSYRPVETITRQAAAAMLARFYFYQGA